MAFDVQKVEQNCFSCKFFRVSDLSLGVCKEDSRLRPDFPTKKLDEVCDKWQSAEQQYYIRVGWLKKEQLRQGAEQ